MPKCLKENSVLKTSSVDQIERSSLSDEFKNYLAKRGLRVSSSEPNETEQKTFSEEVQLLLEDDISMSSSLLVAMNGEDLDIM